MPKVLDSVIRKDGYIRVRLSHSFRDQIKVLAKKQSISVSELVRQLLQTEINKAK